MSGLSKVMGLFCEHYYNAEDVDAVLAEKDKELRHHKYKRCLKMASICRLRARWFGDNAFYKKEQWALKWHRRWLKIAEQFKEAS